MKVTNDYLGLDEDVRKCQNIEPFETTMDYLWVLHATKRLSADLF